MHMWQGGKIGIDHNAMDFIYMAVVSYGMCSRMEFFVYVESDTVNVAYIVCV